MTRTPNYAGLGDVTTYGPIGRTGVTWHDNLNNSVTSDFPSSDTRYIGFTNNARLNGGGWNGLGTPESHQNYIPPGQTTPITCGPAYQAPLCATFSGSASFTLTRLESSLNLVVDSANVVPGSVVHFSAVASPSIVEGQTMAVEVDSSKWTPDPPAQGGEPSDTTTPCGFGLRGSTCTRTIIGSGTLSVVAYVNGKRQEGSVHVTTPALILTANPGYIKTGANVTFTPTWSDGHSTVPDMWSWSWTADHPPGHTSCGFWEDPCTKAVQETGTMRVQVRRNGVFRYATARVVVYTAFTLDADRSSASFGDTVTFTPKYDGVPGPAARWKWVPVDTAAHDTTACAAGTVECRKRMLTSGSMWAYASLGAGQGDSDSKAVTVSPPKITLVCTHGVTRAQQTGSCTASAPAPLTATDWTFYPAGVIGGVDSITHSGSDTVWSGLLVATGRIKVAGKVGTVVATPAFDSITVVDRVGTAWQWKSDTASVTDAPGSFECRTYPHYTTGAFDAGWCGFRKF